MSNPSDRFYSVFVRVDDDDSNQYSRSVAEYRAQWSAARHPDYEYFVMKTVSKIVGNRTEEIS